MFANENRLSEKSYGMYWVRVGLAIFWWTNLRCFLKHDHF